MTSHIKIGNVVPHIQFVGNGIATQFIYHFAIFHENDLEVYLNDIKQTSNYSVAGTASSTGGTVTFSTPPGVGVIVTLRRRLAVQRTTDFQESGVLRAATLNEELDYQTAALQDLAADVAMTVRVPPTDPPANLVLPRKVERAGKMLAFDQDGGVEAKAPVQGGVSVHGQLGGLHNDDHPQYLTENRADAWLNAKTTDSLGEGPVNKYMRLSGTGTSTTAARTDHHHSGIYEPAFPKNSAFNKNFGTGSNEVAAGNHTHTFNLNTFALDDLGNVSEAGRAEGYTLTWSTAAGQWQPRPQSGGGGSGRFGLRNLISNATFQINQRRNFANTLAAGVYGYDRWRGGPSGCTYTLSGSIVTITEGSLAQTIDGVNIIEPGPYTLSWEGTATATVNGSPVSNGGQVMLTPSANVVVAFAGGTLAKPQLEQNPFPTPFEQRPFALELQLCLPDYQKSYNYTVSPGTAGAAANTCVAVAHTPVFLSQTIWCYAIPMRASPTVTVYAAATGAPGHVTEPGGRGNVAVNVSLTGDKSFQIYTWPQNLTPGLYVEFHWVADAEL